MEVQVAQTFGVRIHLLGIEPARGSQSPDLIQEADTTTEWTKAIVSTWLSVSGSESVPIATPSKQTETTVALPPASPTSITEQIFDEVIANLTGEKLSEICKYIDDNFDSIPAEYDRPMLGKLKARLGRNLSSAEHAKYREEVITLIRAKVGETIS